MLQLFAADFLFITPFLLNLVFVTVAYFKFNSTTTLVRNLPEDNKTAKTACAKKSYNYLFIKFILILCILLFLQNFVYLGFCGCF
jgi:hypothetical protein